MRYMVLKFWAKLVKNHQFTPIGHFFENLTNVIFVYFSYAITIIQGLKIDLKGSQNTRLYNFRTNWPMAFLGGKIG